MKNLQAQAKNIRTLLANKKFGIDYYQREYRWERKHVAEMIADLAQVFLENHRQGDRPTAVMKYDGYFLGSIITSDKGGQRFIVDGQQRLTSVTLLLIHLYKSVVESNYKDMISNLIFAFGFGERTYNLDIPNRQQCMDSLFKEDEQLDRTKVKDPSIINILERYDDVESMLPDEIANDESLKCFIDWLIEKVYLVEITAGTDADAYTIFETMNDRGLSLTPAEMLRGYLLSNIDDTEQRDRASSKWDGRMVELHDLGKEEGADAIKSWLRSQHAQDIRQGGRRAKAGDFDVIGTEFHRWVGGRTGRSRKLGLHSSDAFCKFIERDFDFYADWYGVIRRASRRKTDGLESFFYVAQTGFTLQYMAALAPLVVGDSRDVCERKLRTVATAIDCLLMRRAWNWRSITHNAMRVRMFQSITKNIRNVEVDELAETLCRLLDNPDERFRRHEFGLHRQNRKMVHLMLARITDFVITGSAKTSKFEDFVDGRIRDPFQIEHILSQSHRDDWDGDDFDATRNNIGGLLLLPASFNKAYGNMRYEEKRHHYDSQNLLARSLCANAYDKNPRFKDFRDKADLCFKPYEVFKVDAINERQELYRQLAKRIWSTDSIREAAGIA